MLIGWCDGIYVKGCSIHIPIFYPLAYMCYINQSCRENVNLQPGSPTSLRISILVDIVKLSANFPYSVQIIYTVICEHNRSTIFSSDEVARLGEFRVSLWDISCLSPSHCLTRELCSPKKFGLNNFFKVRP